VKQTTKYHQDPEILDLFKLQGLGEAVRGKPTGPASPIMPDNPSRLQTPETAKEDSGIRMPQGNHGRALTPVQMT
jgi:hypothetical protein